MFFKNIDVSWSEAAGGDIPLKNIDVSWSEAAGGDIPLNLIKKGYIYFSVPFT